MTIIDVTYLINVGERHGRRRMCDNHTGEMWWEPAVSMEPVEPLPEASVEQPPADPAPPLVDLLGIREAELDEMFKPLGQKVDAEVLQAVKPARKPRKPKNG